MKESQTIYYLDDDLDDLEFFKEVVESLGHTVKVFLDGSKMLFILENIDEKPDVIFLDVHMPILNGEEILNVIKRSDNLKNIPIVMVSGAYPRKMVKNFMELGVNYLMKKPHINDYKTAVEEVLLNYLQNDQAAG
ncbi:response regulator [Flavobacterium silvisoli]|uniref:Response regulator n=1 Tax=Flavobacterium silvisoli TaxID=2529433 RepID=A0A4Q9YWM1_9FLAO|nr:response regulator [Flavobacterium silvisoli]TBX65759.1 response regulator [Flavobacterium silvisoli]